MRVCEGGRERLSSLDEDLTVGDHSTIECIGEGSSLKVRGDIRCEGHVLFTGNVFCSNFRADDSHVSVMGSLSCDSLEIEDGSLEVKGDLSCKSIDVDERLVVSGKTESEVIEVGGSFEAALVKSRSVEVGGKFEASQDVEVQDIDVGGSVLVSGKINARRLEVGGRVVLVGGGTVSESIEVGGTFESRSALTFGEIEVGGVITLGGQSSGGDIEVGGKLEALGDLAFKRLEVGGTADVRGKASGERIVLGGRLYVSSDLELQDSLEVGGSVEIGGNARTKSIEIGGWFNSKTLRTGTAELGGRVRTEGGIFATGRVSVEKHCRVEGWIRSLDSVRVDPKGEVDWVSAPLVRLEDRTRARAAYAEILEIEDRVDIREEALYTKSLICEGDSRSAGVAPKKVNSIPQEKMWTVTPE